MFIGLFQVNLQFANISSDVGAFQEKLPERFAVIAEQPCVYGYTRKYVLPTQRQKGVAYERKVIHILEAFRVIVEEDVDNVSNDVERKNWRRCELKYAIQSLSSVGKLS